MSRVEDVDETPTSPWWWFSLNRERGGPAYHPHQHLQCPFFVWYFNVTVSTLVFIFPLLACLVILPSSRYKNWSSFFVVLLCLGTGFVLTVVFGSSSWFVGQAAVNTSIGPVKPPVPGKLGLWAGLWHVNLTYVTDNFALNERVEWVTRKDLIHAHKKALAEGWPLALVNLMAEFGGEGTAWRGQLGDGIMAAGLGTSALLIGAFAVWAVWVLLFTVSPELAARPIIFCGLIITTCSLVYVVVIDYHVPHTIIIAGTTIKFYLGFAWWVSTALGICLSFVGMGLLICDIYRPGKLSTIFELDFGSPIHRLYRPAWSYDGTKLSSQDDNEVYRQYPLPRLSSYFSDSCFSTDDEEISISNERKSLIYEISKKLDHSSTESLFSPHEVSSENKIITEDEQTLEVDITPILSKSMLREGETHTALRIPPETLRHRSPEYPNEQKPPSPPPPSLHGSVTPNNFDMPDCDFLSRNNHIDNHSTILVEKHHPKTNASMRTHTARRSTRSYKFHPLFSMRLSYKSSIKKKSLSLSKLPFNSKIRQQSDKEKDKSAEWVDVSEDDSDSQKKV